MDVLRFNRRAWLIALSLSLTALSFLPIISATAPVGADQQVERPHIAAAPPGVDSQALRARPGDLVRAAPGLISRFAPAALLAFWVQPPT